MVYRGKNSSRGGEVLQVGTRDGCAGQTGQESGQIKLMMGFTATRKSKGHRKGRTEQDDIASGKRGAREHVQHASILRSAPRYTSDASFGKTRWSRARQIEPLIRTFNIEGTILCSLPGAKRGRSPNEFSHQNIPSRHRHLAIHFTKTSVLASVRTARLEPFNPFVPMTRSTVDCFKSRKDDSVYVCMYVCVCVPLSESLFKYSFCTTNACLVFCRWPCG
jgi:hypothetical protein